VLDFSGGAGRVHVGAVTFATGQMRGPRSHTLHQLLLPREGGLLVEVDEQRYELRHGEVGLLTPGHRVDLGATHRERSTHVWLAAQRPPMVGRALDALHEAPAKVPASRAMVALFDAAVALEESGAAPRLVLLPLVAIALGLYLRDAGLAAGGTGREHPAVAAARGLIRQRLDDRLTLGDLAAAGHVAPEYLVRLFRRHTGTTPYRFLWDERVRLGVQLLEHTGEPVTRISRRCGFRTSYHFARLVRAKTGLSPTQVRQRGWDPLEGPRVEAIL